MAINNPLSKTHFKFTKDRIQHYSTVAYRCSACGNHYHPKVHSQPYIVQFGAIILGLTLFLLFKFQAPPWLYVMLPLFMGGYIVWYYRKERRVSKAGQTESIRYGDILLDCPQCGCKSGKKVI